jgi:hypothetical protein
MLDRGEPVGLSIDCESAAPTVGTERGQEPDSVLRRWFGRGRSRVRVPDWSPDALSRALKPGPQAHGELTTNTQSVGLDSLVEPTGIDGSSDTSDPLQLAQAPTVAPNDASMADLRLLVERSVSLFGQQTLRWQNSDQTGDAFGVRESALDALGRLRIRMNEVVYLVPIAADHAFKAVSVTPIGLHLLVADLDTGDLLSEMRHDPAGGQ